MQIHIKEDVSIHETILALCISECILSCRLSPFSPPLPQVFDDPLMPEEDMKTVVNDWVNLYINYYKKHVLGEQQEQDGALKELQQELSTLGSQFLAKYRIILKSKETPSSKPPSS